MRFHIVVYVFLGLWLMGDCLKALYLSLDFNGLKNGECNIKHNMY